MFYSNQILARKGPLGLVWIAAHLDRQLKRQQINNTSIPASVDTLLDSEVPLALRLSGQLLLGVVRIYARKVNYLQQDCNDALVKIRVALRPADGVNLPPGSHTAPVESITLLAPKHLTKSSRGGRKAAAGAADRGDGSTAGAVTIDGFDIDVDDFYWEQDVLLGRDGGGGFAGFELAGGFDLGLAAPSGSGPMSQDISGVFGMHSSQEYQEVFDVEVEEAAAVWDLDEIEVERLRAVASQQPSSGVSGLLGLGGTPEVEGPRGKGAAAGAGSPSGSEDHMLQPPPDLDDAMMSSPASPAAAAAATGNAAAAAAGSPVEGHTPMSRISQVGQFADEFGLDLLPPTPASLAGTGGAADLDGTAGYTGGTAAGPTPGTSGPQGADIGALLPPTPILPRAADAPPEDETAPAEGIAGGKQAHQQDEHMDVDQTEAAEQQQEPEQGQQATAAAAAATAKTFERRNTRQQQPAAAAEEEEAAAAAAAAAKGKAAKQKRSASAQLLGQKRRMVIDGYPDVAGGPPGSASKRSAGKATAARRHPPTELPASEVRALLADRTPLLDLMRFQACDKRVTVEAALARSALTGTMSLAAPTAVGPAAAGDTFQVPNALQLPLALSRTAAAGAVGNDGTDSSSSAALAALLGGPGSSRSAAAAAVAACVNRPRGLWNSLLGSRHGLGVLGGLGLQLPAELHDLFVQAAAAGAAAAPLGSAAAVAPVAAPDEIEMEGNEDALELDAGAVPAAARLSAGGGVTRISLTVSVLSTPGSTAAQGATAGTGQAGATAAPAATATPAAADGVQDFAPASIGGITSDFGTGGFCSAGYTPGSLAGDGGVLNDPGSAGGVLQPLDAADVANQQQRVQAYTAGTMDNEINQDDYQEDFTYGEGLDKENSPAVGLQLQKAAAATAGCVGLIGSSARSTQEAVLPWPADAETLQEQEEEHAQQPGDGGFTSRTRLVMRRLQHTAAAAAAGGSSAAAAGATPASAGSRRRISAVPPPSLSAGGKTGAGAAVSLSFSSLTQGHNRLDACRWFYEVLVLGNKGLVDIKQEEAYGDIMVTPNLRAMARI